MIDWHKRLATLSEQHQKNQRSAERLSRLRLLFTLATVLGFLWLWQMAVTALVAFLFTVAKHQQAHAQGRRLTELIAASQRMIARQSGTWHTFAVTPPVFLDEQDQPLDPATVLATHPYASDLDLFGRRSLFQMFNETGTFFGHAMLTHLLTAETDLTTAKLRQQAVAELIANTPFCEELKVTTKLSGTTANPTPLISYLASGPTSHLLLRMARYLPLLTWTGILVQLRWPSPALLVLMLSLIGLQLLAFLAATVNTVPVLGMFSGFNQGLTRYKALFTLIEHEPFTAELNRTMQGFLTQDSQQASLFINKLARLAWAIGLRADGILRLLLNLTCLYDLQLMLAVEKLSTQHQNLARWLRTIGFFEAMVSLAGVGQAFPDWTHPTLSSHQPLSMTHMAHPLLHEPVTNHYTHQKISLITGSNMSGKTTFMRSIGVNMVLAYAGAPVRAQSFTLPMVSLFTSMRITDSVTENMSTFYAELQRIKQMIERARDPQPMLFFIDEIFRGTNSEDRITGAQRVLKQLNQPHVGGFITTHDLEVAATSQPQWQNYHFRESYDQQRIHFDYRLRPGISTTRNAQYLIAMVGIEDSYPLSK